MNAIAAVLGFLGVWLVAYLLITGVWCGVPMVWRKAKGRAKKLRYEARQRWVRHCQSVVDGAYVEQNIEWWAQVGEWELEADSTDRSLPKERRKTR